MHLTAWVEVFCGWKDVWCRVLEEQEVIGENSEWGEPIDLQCYAHIFDASNSKLFPMNMILKFLFAFHAASQYFLGYISESTQVSDDNDMTWYELELPRLGGNIGGKKSWRQYFLSKRQKFFFY